ncbi:hypothetical protein [Sediminibacterium soli]|uniref:hypothetical protein n=1 Tax=Sediminibacterium soli TaxID=2698829 RepID=UPI001379E24A|nr:hypothetical protein [Sediminibacterium soli]NCI47435.1 hypothetical protein [Sediminibacterium soli]
MKKIIFCCFCLSTITSIAQKQTYDLVIYTPPAGWKKEEKSNLTAYSMTDNEKNSWCQIFIVKSTVSKGSIGADFESEWQELAVKNYHPSEMSQSDKAEEADGWKIKSGVGKFVFNKSDANIILTTFSGYGRCVSIVAITNSGDYSSATKKFWESIDLVKPSATTPVTPTATDPAVNNHFAFNTTHFDDGWTSTVQENWVELTKGSMKVLLHYPKEGTVFAADPGPLTDAAWNILVAPRYSNLQNYKTAYITTYDRPYLGMGYATENVTGKNVFIVLFRQGQTGWLEFIAPDKNSFLQQYKFDPETIQWDSNSDLLIPLINMTNYNRFSVAASDLTGKWTSDFTGIQQLYNVYTGQYAGMNINQSNEEFVFTTGNSYNWKLLVVNGTVGNTKYAEVKSAGQFSVPNNWQIHFSRIETGPRTFHAFWSCIKGARILNLLDANTTGAGIYTKYGLAR